MKKLENFWALKFNVLKVILINDLNILISSDQDDEGSSTNCSSLQKKIIRKKLKTSKSYDFT
jgi:hypothetical protein